MMLCPAGSKLGPLAKAACSEGECVECGWKSLTNGSPCPAEYDDKHVWKIKQYVREDVTVIRKGAGVSDTR
jgi:hypothetical protein